MALPQAKIQPTIEEKRLLTLKFLEASVMQGSKVTITPVDKLDISKLSGESASYLEPIDTYITFDDRPSVKLLRSYGWYREDQEILPIVAYIPTHLLYHRKPGQIEVKAKDIANYTLLQNEDYQDLVKHGESEDYALKYLPIKRLTIVDIYYDYLPDVKNTFYVADVKVDLIATNYVVNLMPYRFEAEPEGDKDSNTPLFKTDIRNVTI